MTDFPPDRPEDENWNDFEADNSADEPDGDVWEELFDEPWADALRASEPDPWDDLWSDSWIEDWEEPDYEVTNLPPDDARSRAELEAAEAEAAAEEERDRYPNWLTIIITILLIAALTFPLMAPILYSQQNTAPRPQPSPTPTSPIIFSA